MSQTQTIEQRTRLATTPPAKTTKPAADFEALLEKEHRAISYVPFGEQDDIKLTVPIVQQLLCEKTKSGKTCSENDAKKFIVMCRAMRLNPFEKDAFIAGYDTRQHDGSYAPKFSQIIAHQAYLKRAEASPHFKGMDSGIILRGEENELIERETDFVLPEETKLVVGGWAKVYREDRQAPIYRRCSVAARRPDYESKFWSDDKTPEMICKCAEADALRSAFPTLIGGLSGELGDVTQRFIQPTTTPANGRSSLVETVAPTTTPAPRSEPRAEEQPPQQEDNSNAELAPAPEKPKTTSAPAEGSAKAELQKIVTEAGFTFDHLQKVGMETGLVDGADSISGFDEITEKNAKRLINAKAGLLAKLAEAKGAK
jgi:phage recombination protein Bet